MKKTNKIPFILILIIAMIACLYNIQKAEASSVNEVHLKDGDVYDITPCPKNTIIYIDDKTASRKDTGEVTLFGVSEKVWVNISVSKGKTVNVKLADGLTITPSSASASGTGKGNDTLGHSRAGIYIDETKHAGGIVLLTSKKDAKVIVGSYTALGWQAVPAIMKNDSKTTLVFNTEDPSDPGTIVAQVTDAGHFTGACAIGAFGHGSGGHASSSYTVGNILFQAGYIRAYGWCDGPGIGAYAYSHVKDLDFCGAYVEAFSGDGISPISECGGAGIGTGYRGNVGTISISGGTVKAYGRGSIKDSKGRPLRATLETCGPGIGVSDFGHIDEINISGGTVVAYGGTSKHDSAHNCSGAGIGTAVFHYDNTYGWSTADRIIITGGDITAYGGDEACGIGGCVGEILIAPNDPDTELKIDASIDRRPNRDGGRRALGAGIGVSNNASNGTFSSYPGNITIKGGDITATAGWDGSPGWYGDGYFSHGAGIGPGLSGKCSSISISGGTINAKGGYCGPGIGGHSNVLDGMATVDSIHISGGTITATKPSFSKDGDPLSGIGGYKNGDGDHTDIIITGGSVISNGSDYAIGLDTFGQPKNDAGETVYGTKFKFHPDTDEWTGVDSFTFVPGLNYDYGLNDVYVKSDLDTDDNILEFWIPKSSNSIKYNCSTDIANRRYGAFDSSFALARVEAGDTTTLTSYTDITYVNEVTGDKYTGFGVYGSDRLSINTQPPAIPKYELEGYKDGSGKKVANGAFGQVQLPLLQSTAYVDRNGKWKAKDKTLTLYMMLHQTQYSVSYDKNKPATASHDVEGQQMADSEFSTSGSSTLRDNAYSLKGWTFTGWNTAKDGSGDSFRDGDRIEFKTEWGENLTLYAQWEPKTYTVTFNPGDGSGQPYTQDFEYDTAGTLDPNTFTYEDHTFLGWQTLALGSFYKNQATVTNICILDVNGNPVGQTLYAEWLEADILAIIITDDGIPVTDPDPDCITLYTDSQVLQPDFQKTNWGYVAENIPEGTYGVELSGDLSVYVPLEEVEVIDGCASLYIWDYYTVTMTGDSDDEIDAYVCRQGQATTAQIEEHLYNGEEIEIHAAGRQGYHFDGYTVSGVAPEGFVPFDSGRADQSGLAVRGKADFTAHAEANLYHVKFSKNKPATASHDVKGEMEGQDFIFDQQQDLQGCEFMLTGWTFTGWNSKADGSGIAFDDEAQMNEVSWQSLGYPSDGSDITLYAQWQPKEYIVYFSATNATSGQMDPEVLTYDTPQRLTTNAFARTDWHFLGWNTEPAGGGTSFEDRQEVINLSTGRSITLYAQWEHDYYTVIFDKNDDEAAGEMKEEHVWTNCAYELPLCSYYKAGYGLEGWTTEADGSGTRCEDGEAVENLTEKGGTITLYAQWKPNKFIVKYDANGGEGKMEDQNFTYDVAQNLEPNRFTRAHYVFNSWNTMPDGSGESLGDREIVKNLTPLPDYEVILYAQWEKAKHTIKYDLNGGTMNGKTGVIEVVANYGDKITIMEAPTRKGYTFDYWKGSKYYPGDRYTVESDHTLSAVWKKNKKPEPEPDPDDHGGGVRTGDDSDLTLWLALLLAGAAGVLVSFIIRRSHRSRS